MKKILFGLALLISFSVNAQIRVCQLPQVTSGTLNDYIIKEDSTCHGTRKIKISDFIATYSLGGGGGSTDTTSLSNRIDHKIDTLYKNSTGDSFIYKINGRRHALVDSVGSSTGSVSPIESSWSDALGRIGSNAIVAGQAYKVNNDDLTLPAGVDYILIWGIDANAYNNIAQVKLTSLTNLVFGDYDLVGNAIAYINTLTTIYEASNLLGSNLVTENLDYKIIVNSGEIISILTKGVQDGGGNIVFDNNVKVVLTSGQVVDGTYDVATWWLTYEKETTIQITFDGTNYSAIQIGKNTTGVNITVTTAAAAGRCEITWDNDWMANTLFTINATNNTGIATVDYAAEVTAGSVALISGAVSGSFDNSAFSGYNPVIINIKNYTRINLD